MPSYTIKQLQVHTVHKKSLESFSPDDNNKWHELIQRIDPELLDFRFPNYPKNTTGKIEDWLKLYELLNISEYENCEEDYWISDDTGSTEYFFEILSEDGSVIYNSDN